MTDTIPEVAGDAQATSSEVSTLVASVDALTSTVMQEIPKLKVAAIAAIEQCTDIALQSQVFNKTLSMQCAFAVNDAGAVVVNGGFSVSVGTALITAEDGIVLTMPTELSVGTDYAIYATLDGLVISSNFTTPDNYTSDTSRRIGGFHYQDGFANEYSVYDLKYRPSAPDPRGMVRTIAGFWADIYLLNTSPGALGTSAYGATIADGSAPPKIPAIFGGDNSAQYPNFTQYIATEILAAYGKKLPNQHEFSVLAKGSVTGHANGTDPVTTLFDADSRSMYGCEQVSGHMWQWGSEIGDRGNGTSGYAFVASDTNGEGQVYQSGASGVFASLFGAYWDLSGFAGARASDWYYEPWNSATYIGARGVCDHLQLL